MNRVHALRATAGLLSLALPAAAQFGNEWVSFQNDTAARLRADPLLSTFDPERKDYASADLDQDGWLDLVAVRRAAGVSTGPRVNLLFLNERGVLTDSTASYATASDVPGDQGFSTPTTDFDVQVADFDNDGWLDLVTAPALGFGLPKALSHPRVYMNLRAAGGAWNGLRFESPRFPQLFAGSALTAPDFASAAAGDIDDDGDADLHFTDNHASAGPDTDDRLLVNDGLGFFADESTLRMTPAMLSSGVGTSSCIVELNGLPGLDIVRNEAALGEALYNNPAHVGFFNIVDGFQVTAAYFVGAGDLNNDGRIDTVFTDDGQDRYRYNLSTDALGRVVWGANKTFSFLTGGDDGFGEANVVADLDGDAWKDVIICDVNCGGRIHVYHNPGGAVGSEITLREEAGGSGAADWKGAKGLTANDLQGGYDVAAFDLDNDGDQDLVLGRCAGMSVWMNQTFEPFCQKDLGFGGPSASLTACGAELSTGASTTLAVEASSANAPGAFAVGNVGNPTYIPLFGATIVPWLPVITVPFQTDASGTFAVSVQGGMGPATWYVQAVVLDPLEPTGFATTNALEVALLP